MNEKTQRETNQRPKDGAARQRPWQRFTPVCPQVGGKNRPNYAFYAFDVGTRLANIRNSTTTLGWLGSDGLEGGWGGSMRRTLLAPLSLR